VQRLGGFQVTAQIGRGKSTEVYAGVRLATGERVVIRMVQQWILDRAIALEPAFLDRFRDSTLARSRVDSMHLVAIEEVGDDAGMPFVVCELVTGRRMSESAGGRYTCAAALGILDQLCDALSALRTAGIMECLPIPEKLYIVPHEGSEIVKLDTLFVERPPKFEYKGGSPPIPRYFSPQRLMGRDFAPTDDVFALGMFGYELLTGRLPFEGPGRAGLITAMLESEAEPPSHHADVPSYVDDVFMTCLHKHTTERYADLAALRDALHSEMS
jgi:eukaryotic-like serine/threonine-protein kinase